MLGKLVNHHPSPAADHYAVPDDAEIPGRWLALALLCLAQFMLILDVTVINVALPDLSRDIGLAPTNSAWTIAAYSIPFAGLMLLGGRAADLLGSRRVFLAGLVIFTLASLAAGFASDATMLLAARAAQGVGAAFLSPSALSTVTRLFTGHSRHRALAVWGAIGGTGAAVGVLLGGLLTAGPGWRWIFFLNVPIGILVAVAVPLVVPASRGLGDGKFDVTGAILATLGTASLVVGITQIGSDGNGPLFVGGGVALLGAFAAVERFTAKPLVDLRLLARRPIQAGALLMLVATGLLVGSFFLLSFALQGRFGWTALDTGLGFLPVAVATIVGAHLAGRAVGHLGGRIVAVSGLVIAAASLAYASTELGSPMLLITAVAATALGLGGVFVSATTTAMAHAGPHEIGVVSGLVNTFHELGGAMGAALLAVIAAVSLAAPEVANGFVDALMLSAAVAGVTAVLAIIVVPGGKPAPGAPRFVH
jgi:EmrB/QacA subfamily drug resistance transporter